jgi:hypothetical protein
MLALSLLLASAFAADPNAGAHYSTEDIARLSKVYSAASEKVAPMYSTMTGRSESYAAGLRAYESSLDLLGERAPDAERQRQQAMSAAFRTQQEVVRNFADQMVGDFDRAFLAAVTRATVEMPGVKPCSTYRIDASPGRPSRRIPNEKCNGPDASAAIAAKIDEDATLAAEVRVIAAREWPQFDLPVAAQAPIGGSDRWLDVHRTFEKALPKTLAAITRADESARRESMKAISQGSPRSKEATKNKGGRQLTEEEIAKLNARGREITGATAEKRAMTAAPLLEAADPVFAKWTKKDKASVGWCANPAVFGGCTGTDQTKALSDLLLENKRILKVLPDTR